MIVTKHRKLIFGLILDLIDIHIEVLRVGYYELSNDRVGESNDAVHVSVQAVHAIQNRYFSKGDIGSRLEQCTHIRDLTIENDCFRISPLIGDPAISSGMMGG